MLGDNARADRTRAMISSLLLESGRPVPIVPEGNVASVPPRHVVTACKPTTQAARTLHDAMPLLQAAGRVDLGMIDPVAEDGAGESQPGAAVLAHPGRHSVQAQPVILHAKRASDSLVLLDHLKQSGAQLLVAGGYGHSRLRQWALGGMTRELLFSARVPVLFSH